VQIGMKKEEGRKRDGGGREGQKKEWYGEVDWRASYKGKEGGRGACPRRGQKKRATNGKIGELLKIQVVSMYGRRDCSKECNSTCTTRKSKGKGLGLIGSQRRAKRGGEGDVAKGGGKAMKKSTSTKGGVKENGRQRGEERAEEKRPPPSLEDKEERVTSGELKRERPVRQHHKSSVERIDEKRRAGQKGPLGRTF